MIQPLERTELTTPARCALKAKSLRTACAALLAFGLMSVMGSCVQAQGAEPGLEEPFSYPASLLRARSTYTVSPATPVLLGSTVVVLEQAPENRIRCLGAAEVMARLYNNVRYPFWDEGATAASLETLDALVREVPVYLLACRPDGEAVRITHDAIFCSGAYSSTARTSSA